MKKNAYVVDVSSYNPSDLSTYKKCGATMAIVKVSEGVAYRNPKGAAQIASAKSLGMECAGYFFCTFSNDLNGARAQALYAVESAKIMGLSGGSYLATDWETGTGASYNNVNGGKSKNTQAVLLTMDVIASAGYKPLLYSGAYLLKSNIDTSIILSHYPNSLWVASYPTSNAVSTANMNYFPAIPGVALWQFTDNWNGIHTDASIAVIDSDNKNNAEGDEDMSWHPEINVTELGRFKVTRPDGAQLYKDSDLTIPIAGAVKPAGGTYKIFKARNGAVNAGGEQWFSQADGLTKVNPLSVNQKAKGIICKIIADDAYTQNETTPNCAGIKYLPAGSSWKVISKKGDYLEVGGEKDGRYVLASKCKIILW